ncbi:hypothetical protein ACI65C_004326 [Semiaphis heraclei]
MKTVNGVVHNTYAAAAVAMGLLEDDSAWLACMTESSTLDTPRQLRCLYVTVCFVSCLEILFDYLPIMSTKLSSRPTQQQMQELVELLKLDPQLVSGSPKKSRKNVGKQLRKRLMLYPASINAGTNGTWQDTKASTKSKAAAMSNFVRRGTGGGPPTASMLNDVEESALPLIKTVAISGHTLSSASLAEFSFEPDQSACKIIKEVENNDNIQSFPSPVFPKPNRSINSSCYGPQSSITREQVQNTRKRTSSAARLDEGNVIANRGPILEIDRQEVTYE